MSSKSQKSSSSSKTTDNSIHGGETSKQWGANVFRLVKNRWEKLEPEGVGNHALMVSPRKNRIVIPGIRQMFSLSEHKGARNRSFVVQRDNRILMIPSKRSRAILLVFENIQDCREFSDRFVQLNPTTSSSESSPTFVDESRLEQDQVRLFSYISRLLQDDDFRNFVHRLETLIGSTEDGGEILDHLASTKLTPRVVGNSNGLNTNASEGQGADDEKAKAFDESSPSGEGLGGQGRGGSESS
jgi:hypothetical protein